ncbi:MAG TPA: DUF1488 domain-containing protein [Afifellaceae bacterium]|nr:DUF1488 domain-containing protein [Afifellaceae bacterium]
MALTFPNPSRSYDEAGQRVRFHGHEGMFEIAFLVDIKAFAEAASEKVPCEADCLAAFDAARNSIQEVARKAYSRGRKNLYVLTPADFR